LIETGESKKAINLISNFGFDPYDFPQLILGAKINAIRYFAKNQPWFKVEELFSDSKEMLSLFVEELMQDNQIDLAQSMIKRRNLLIEEFSPNFQLKFGADLSKELKYSENILFTQDAYAPTEEIVNKDVAGTFWNLKNFNIEMENGIFWVDDVNSSEFYVARRDLLSAPIVGLDSEYRLNTNRFEKRQTSILQIATENQVYIFDVQSLGDRKEYQELIWELFADEQILKVTD